MANEIIEVLSDGEDNDVIYISSDDEELGEDKNDENSEPPKKELEESGYAGRAYCIKEVSLLRSSSTASIALNVKYYGL